MLCYFWKVYQRRRNDRLLGNKQKRGSGWKLRRKREAHKVKWYQRAWFITAWTSSVPVIPVNEYVGARVLKNSSRVKHRIFTKKSKEWLRYGIWKSFSCKFENYEGLVMKNVNSNRIYTRSIACFSRHNYETQWICLYSFYTPNGRQSGFKCKCFWHSGVDLRRPIAQSENLGVFICQHANMRTKALRLNVCEAQRLIFEIESKKFWSLGGILWDLFRVKAAIYGDSFEQVSNISL